MTAAEGGGGESDRKFREQKTLFSFLCLLYIQNRREITERAMQQQRKFTTAKHPTSHKLLYFFDREKSIDWPSFFLMTPFLPFLLAGSDPVGNRLLRRLSQEIPQNMGKKSRKSLE